MDRACAPRRIYWNALGIALAWLAFAAFGQTPVSPELAAIDKLIEQQEYTFAVRRLRAAILDPAERLAWLRRHAEAGHPPLQNELAIHLLDTDVVESLKWFTRGRLARILDAAECDAAGVSQFPDPALEKVRVAGVARPEILLKATDDAMAWVTSGVERPSSRWMCGTRSLPDREAKRTAALDEMRLATRRLRGYVNAVEAGKKFPVAVYDVEASASFIWQNSAWADDGQLLFIASEPPHATARLYMWNAGQSAPVKLFPDLIVYRVCIRAGQLTLEARNQHEEAFGTWEGTVESVQPVIGGRNAMSDSLNNCMERWTDKRVGNDRVQSLPRNDGHLLTRKGHPNAELIRNDGQVVQLPIVNSWTQLMDYAPWSGAYLVSGPGTYADSIGPLVSRWAVSADVELFSVWPDGRTERHVVPYGLWDTMSGSPSTYRFTRLGLVISGGTLDEGDVDGWNGLFLFPFGAKEAIRLSADRATIGAISRNGCRIALSSSGGSPKKPKLYVRVVDLCVGAWNAIK